jgi:hypothetical protein
MYKTEALLTNKLLTMLSFWTRSRYKRVVQNAATWQQVATVVVVELLIAFSLIAWELLAPQRVTPLLAQAEIVRPTRAPRQRRPQRAPAVALIEAAPQPGDVAQFAVAHLRPADGASVAIADLYRPYEDWCRREGAAAVSRAEFDDLFAALCDLSGFKRGARQDGEPLYLGLRIAA